MELRTDLAIETPNIHAQQSGISLFTSHYRKARISRISVDTHQAATQIGRPVGQYVTVEMPPLSDNEEELIV